ncbi:hypothetical protein D0B54_12825 [Solimonas sp. K1W22B-7]|uniref:hypothetical protein n=1 Tax=Solimonas sp. K1W22B-7 TaxID=2303331 RepID=UPI000E32E8A4|nr:hypothetical protein [Solimonas sp. K1W22B-7]AXQ29522.1 hypothetical protein D0B54_12825 [Solimonas sp. K1W22B-7]
MKLEDTLGKTISDFCRNGYVNTADNHCAHFVSHVLEVDSGYDCRLHTGKPHAAASLRVHELFAGCPKVGLFKDAPAAPFLVFVTAKGNVDLANHSMRNVPQKHVGICDGTHVYNYSNTDDRVVRQTPPDFLKRFDAVYDGDQALFYGTMPPGAKLPERAGAGAGAAPASVPTLPPALASTRPAVVLREVAASQGSKDYFAKIGAAAEFYVARSIGYESYKGIYQPTAKCYGPVYKARDYAALYGPAAALVGVIAVSESGGYFNRVNSYDRAAFTFGFFQLAAHTPDDNLILLFRQLTARHAGFRAQFPELAVQEGRLHRRLDGGVLASLEREYPRPQKPQELNLKDFMNYLNPDPAAVGRVELENAARLVLLANGDASFNDLQVNVAVEISMRKLRRLYDPWYGLDGRSDLVCTAVADIHHQGRGSKTEVRAALGKSGLVKQLTELCRIGAGSYPERCASLRKALDKAKADGLLGSAVFDRASGLFKPSTGWIA